MITLYLKQSWKLMKQNKLFTSIYVAGTALAIATTMIMTIVYYIKIAPIYPEVNRGQTFYLTISSFINKESKGSNQWAYSYQAVKEWFYTLKNVEAVSAEYKASWNSPTDYIQSQDGSEDFEVSKKMTDPGFFRIYQFRFIEGKPFTESDLTNGIRSAVITDVLARRIFGTNSGVIGKEFSLNYLNFRVCGVVKSTSYLTKDSYAHLYIPYSTESGFEKPKTDDLEYYGSFNITFLISSAAQEKTLRQELAEIVRKFNASNKRWEFSMKGHPISHTQMVFQDIPKNEFSWLDVFRHYFIIVLVLLLVPALNLSGMIAGRMDARLPEMGIRKSFGANRRRLLNQVIWENLLLTLTGGLFGLLLAWIILVAFRDWVFAIFEKEPSILMEGVSIELSSEMLVAPTIFLSALLLCIVLNLLSALIPAWHSLKSPIIKSLNEKR